MFWQKVGLTMTYVAHEMVFSDAGKYLGLLQITKTITEGAG